MQNNELLSILEQLERDKGIDKEVLIEAVESAVASAARKVWTVDKEEEIEVTLDRVTGKIAAFASGEEIRSSEFGRIAAQTAKQVVFQKIREAEKEWIRYILVIGQKEANSQNLSIRDRKTGDVREISFDDFLNEINEQTKEKPFTGLNLPKYLSKRPQLMV